MPVSLQQVPTVSDTNPTLYRHTFLRADELKQRFAVYGDFYQVTLGEQEYACRSVLELIAHDKRPADPNQIHFMNPDLLVVMMNPGSSRPLTPGYTPRHMLKDGVDESVERVQTRPDNTQYQIMRVMVAKGFQHARILNLSDLREPKSVVLMPMLQSLRQIGDGDRHSIFCDQRDQERLEVMGPRAMVPVLVGWGRHKGLRSLAEQCQRKLHGWHLVGVPVEGDGPFYAHPSPMLQSKKDQWLAAVLEQLS